MAVGTDLLTSIKVRMLIAFVIGVALHWYFFWGFLSYSHRETYKPSRIVLMFLVGLSGFAVNIGVQKGIYRVASCILGGLFLSHVVLIIVDCWSHPTNHNLAPFEFIIIGFFRFACVCRG